MCQLCLRGIKCISSQRINFDSCQVHHIVPLSVDKSLAFEGDNLITLCTYHHEMAEQGAIDPELLTRIAKEQEQKLEAKLGRSNESGEGLCT